MITVFADKYLFAIEEFLPDECHLNLYDPDKDLPSSINEADALLIRTVTKVDERLLKKLPDSIQFIATGSAGTDHVNKELLDKKQIAFADAAGCNSCSVAEYVATSLLLWAEDVQKDLRDKTVGIIGAGHVGNDVSDLLGKMDISTIAYDPPRQEREEQFHSASLEEVLACDILTLHTPLTYEGKYATFHWLDEDKIKRTNHSFELVINTARGGVVNEQALLKAFREGSVEAFIIDVWEDEPLFHDPTAKNACIKTPHIAGYSRQAKLRASKMIAEALCRHFSLSMPSPSINLRENLPDVSLTGIEPMNLIDILTHIHPIREYEERLISLIGLSGDRKAQKFNKLRSTFPLRNEFRFLNLPEAIFHEFPVLKKLTG